MMDFNDTNNNNTQQQKGKLSPLGQWPAEAFLTQVEREVIWDISPRLPTKRKGLLSHVRDMINEAKKGPIRNVKYVLTENFELLWTCVAASSETAIVSDPEKILRLTVVVKKEGFSYNTINNGFCVSSVYLEKECVRLYWAVKPREELVRMMNDLKLNSGDGCYSMPVIKDYLTNEGRALLHSCSMGDVARVHQLVSNNWGDVHLEPDQVIPDGVSECECIPLKIRGPCGHVRVAQYALKIGIFPREPTPITIAMECYNLVLVHLWISDERVQKQNYWKQLLVHLKVVCDMKGSHIVDKNGYDLFEEFELFLSDCILGVPAREMKRADIEFRKTDTYRLICTGKLW